MTRRRRSTLTNGRTSMRTSASTGGRSRISTSFTKRIARKLTPNGTGTSGRTRVAEEGQVRRHKHRVRDELRSTYQQSFW
jgi:hypothetical protein